MALLAAAPAAAHAAAAGSVTHAAGAVSATVAWDATADAGDLGIANPQLWVVRGGVRYDLTIADICEEGCVLSADSRAFPSILKVADLDGDGEPEVLVDTFSGGAHCCLTTRVEVWDGTGYRSHDVQWGDVEYTLKDADGNGTQELVGSDPRFAYAFSSYADSGFPVLVYNLVGGRPVDTTKKYPKLIEHDAFHWRGDVRAARRGADVRGILAAYAADEYRLGRGRNATAEIAHQRRLGHISKAFGPFLLKRLRAWQYR
ncbi:hypothetical protein [Conexibacter woesei]|uniref:hypothetical protein n=1 Tax=Conexibacter woesei TaxID=191495 RepID=UPI0003FED345|nr:hypothetical protein [Conexibacter woesei]